MQPTDGVRMVHAVLNERKQLLLKTENVKEVFFVQKLFRCTLLLYCTVPYQYESLLYSYNVCYRSYFSNESKICPMSFKKTYLLRQEFTGLVLDIWWHIHTHTQNVIVASRLLYFIHACTIHNHKYYITVNQSMFRQCSEHRMCG